MNKILSMTIAASVALLSTVAVPAKAQSYVYGATAELMSGVQGGDQEASKAVGRARTTLRIGADAYVDEFPKSILGISGLVSIEPRAAAGFDVRYLYRVKERLQVGAGGVGYVFPASMFGGTAEVTYRLPMSGGGLTLGPQVNVFVQGSDLPSDAVIWQVLARVGYRFDL